MARRNPAGARVEESNEYMRLMKDPEGLLREARHAGVTVPVVKTWLKQTRFQAFVNDGWLGFYPTRGAAQAAADAMLHTGHTPRRSTAMIRMGGQRAAIMARRNNKRRKNSPDYTVVHLERALRLDSGGYAPDGRYFGRQRGTSVYPYIAVSDYGRDEYREIRAGDRATARKLLAQRYPSAKISR